VEEYNLKKSKEVVGPLYPVLLDADGNVIDGLHRREADPNWPGMKLDWVKDEKTKNLVRTHANLQRRYIPEVERKKSFTELAQHLKREGVKRGTIVTKLAEISGFTDRYVRKLLPKEFRRGYTVPEPESELVPIECDLHRLVDELRESVKAMAHHQADCGKCQLSPHCGKLKAFYEGEWLK